MPVMVLVPYSSSLVGYRSHGGPGSSDLDAKDALQLMHSATLEAMKKTMSEQNSIPLESTERGLMAGMHRVAAEGYEWRSDLRPAFEHGYFAIGEETSNEGPWLVRKGACAGATALRDRQYPLLRRTGLLAAWDELTKGPTDAAIVRFADRYGLLGNGRVVRLRGAKQFVLGLRGEPAWEWQTAALTFRRLRELWTAVATLRDADSYSNQAVERSAALIKERMTQAPGRAFIYQVRSEGAGAGIERARVLTPPEGGWHKLVRHESPGDEINASAYLVHLEINENLAGKVNAVLLPYRGSVLRFLPSTLLGALWLLFALEVSGEAARQIPCRHCSAPFAPRRRDQRYCSKRCKDNAGYHRGRASGESGSRLLSARS